MRKNKVNPTVALKKYLTNKNVEWCKETIYKLNQTHMCTCVKKMKVKVMYDELQQRQWKSSWRQKLSTFIIFV